MSWNPLAVRCFKRKWERGTKENKWETNGDEKFQKLSLCSIHIIFHLFDINFHSKQCECMNFYDNTRNTYVKSHLSDVRFIFVCLAAFCAAQLANAIAYLSTRHIESVHSDAYVLLVLWTMDAWFRLFSCMRKSIPLRAYLRSGDCRRIETMLIPCKYWHF